MKKTATRWVLAAVLLVGAPSFAQETVVASPGDVDPLWEAAVAEAGGRSVEYGQTFELEGEAFCVFVASGEITEGPRERNVIVVADRATGPLTTLSLPSVQTTNGAVAELFSARIENNARTGPLLFVYVDTTLDPELTSQRAWIVKLVEGTLVTEFEASEWRDDGPEGMAHFERAAHLVENDEGGVELILQTLRSNADGRTSRSRTLLRTWE